MITTLARRLNRSEFEPHLATFAIEAYLDDIPQDVITHKVNARELRWAIPKLIALVRRVRPHVILSTLVETNVAILLARPFFPRGTRVVVRDGSNVSDILAHLVSFPFAWRQAYRYLYPRADAIVCMSQAMRRDALQQIPIDPQRIHLIYNGVDVTFIEQRAAGDSPFLGNGINFVAAGRLNPEKNFSLLLDAFALIHEALPTSRLTLLGSGPQRELLARKALDLQIANAVVFAGFQENPYPFYRYADVYLQTSLFEGMPNVLLEVLALGTPAVATLAGGVTGEVASVTSLVSLVREPDAHTFANIALEVIRGRREESPHDNFLRTFSADRMIMEYESLFHNLVAATQDPMGCGSEAAGSAV